MIVLYTDYGYAGPYVGQLHYVLQREAPEVARVDLMHDVPGFAIRPAAYLLAALAKEFMPGTVCLAVIDPGVGGERRGAIVEVDGRWFVGPDNGLFNILVQQGVDIRWFDIQYQPERLSNTFHGRDLFAPVAARIARGDPVTGTLVDWQERLVSQWPVELLEVVYIDGFGNLMTGMHASSIRKNALLTINGISVSYAPTFCGVPFGQLFWYENSNGLVEIAANKARADLILHAGVGSAVSFPTE